MKGTSSLEHDLSSDTLSFPGIRERIKHDDKLPKLFPRRSVSRRKHLSGIP
jgi:hypothetical protein